MLFPLLLVGIYFAYPAMSQDSPQDMPECASHCYQDVASTNGTCSETDTACLCRSENYLNSISCCVLDSCSQIHYNTTAAINQRACSVAGVSIPSTLSCSSTQTSMECTTSKTSHSISISQSMTEEGDSTTTTSAREVSTLTGTAMAVTNLVKVSSSIAPFTPVKILTGTCTSPRIAFATDTLGQITLFPWVGCSPEEPNCCPFDVHEERLLTACPEDYTTTSNACCPSGFAVLSTGIAQQTPCYSTVSVGLVAKTTPAGQVATLVTNMVFTKRYELAPQNPTGLSSRTKVGIVVGAVAGSFCLAFAVIYSCLRKAKGIGSKTENAQPINSRKVTVPLLHPKPTMTGAVSLHDIQSVHSTPYASPMSSASPQNVRVSGMTTPHLPWGSNRSNRMPLPPPQLPELAAIPSSPKELAGSTVFHENHPPFVEEVNRSRGSPAPAYSISAGSSGTNNSASTSISLNMGRRGDFRLEK